MEKIRNLLNQVTIISKKNAEILDATGGQFNMFRVCGVNHYENTHSAIIAEFLNTYGTHGLKSKLLECFIETLGEKFSIQDFKFEKSRVRTEYSTEEGRIDILIEDNHNKAIIIENKIYAIDQNEQLKRYNRFAKKYKNGYQIIYLTLLGDNASVQSGEGVSYLPISYKESIIEWLEKCVSIASRFPIVRETIIQYINHLKQLTNQDMDTKNKEEITEVLSNIDNLKAAKVIFQNYSTTFNYLIKKHFNSKMEEFAKQKGLDYHYERSEEFYVKFYLTSPNWQGKYWIGFTFEENRCFYGICNKLNTYRVSDENRKIIHKRLNELGINSRKESNWWPFYAHFENLTLETWESDIIKSDIFLNDCKEKIEKLLAALDMITNLEK
ncbi:MAG: PD-(D/E)XK nuclease family protein [bacterium]